MCSVVENLEPQYFIAKAAVQTEHLRVQSQQWKQQNNVWNRFIIVSFSFFVVNFEHIMHIVLVFLLWTSN